MNDTAYILQASPYSPLRMAFIKTVAVLPLAAMMALVSWMLSTGLGLSPPNLVGHILGWNAAGAVVIGFWRWWGEFDMDIPASAKAWKNLSNDFFIWVNLMVCELVFAIGYQMLPESTPHQGTREFLWWAGIVALVGSVPLCGYLVVRIVEAFEQVGAVFCLPARRAERAWREAVPAVVSASPEHVWVPLVLPPVPELVMATVQGPPVRPVQRVRSRLRLIQAVPLTWTPAKAS